MKFNPVTILGYGAVALMGFGILNGVTFQRPVQNADIGDPGDVGSFLGSETVRVFGNFQRTFREEQIRESGLIAPDAEPPPSSCAPWDNQCKQRQQDYEKWRDSQNNPPVRQLETPQK